MLRLLTLTVLATLVGLAGATSASEPAGAASSLHYVDCSSKQSGDGSRSRPWNRIGDVNAHGAFKPGDTISFRRGTTCSGRLHPTGNGAEGAPITVGAYGSATAKPTIHGRGTENFTGTIDLRNQQWWTLQDLHVTNSGGKVSTQVYRSGVSVRNQDGGALRGIVVQRLDVDDVSSSPNELNGSSREWGGITVAAGGVQGDSFPGIVIRDNRLIRVGRTGIAVMNWEFPTTFNEGVRITGNTVRRARGDGIIAFGAQHTRIDHNVVAYGNDEWPCPLCGPITPLTANAGIWPARSSHIRIDHNEVYGMHEPGGDGQAFDSDQSTDHILFEYNYAHDNEGGGIFFCGSRNVTVRFNIFQNNRRSAFNFIGNVPAHDTAIYNNTIYTKNIEKTKALRTFNVDKATEPAGRVTFKNNIVINRATSFRGWWQWPGTDVKTAANTLVGVHGIGRPHDKRTSREDPGLRAPGTGKRGFASLSGYRLKNGSKALRGVAIPADATRDFFGRKVDPRHPPRGAAG